MVSTKAFRHASQRRTWWISVSHAYAISTKNSEGLLKWSGGRYGKSNTEYLNIDVKCRITMYQVSPQE